MRRVRKQKKIYDPRVWPTWAIVGVGWVVARLPLKVIAMLARGLGAVAYRVAAPRRTITEVNLALCYPELSDTDRRQLARDAFTHTAMGALESAMVWLNPRRDIASRTKIRGIENFHEAKAKGRGVLLLAGHFSALDVMGPAVAPYGIDVMYRQNKNPVWEWLQVTGRSHHFEAVIEREDVRLMLKRLKQGHAIWYAGDQDYGRRHSVFAPFFGIPTASITATARLAQFNDSPVLLVTHFRDLNKLTWTIEVSEPLSNFPSDDEVADATRINQAIEAAIRSHPEQYLWMHRRFKTRPDGEPSPYRRPDS
jgi:KDO2-lipid IV(A) lauroyltransferase